MASDRKRTMAEQLECVDKLRAWAKSRYAHCWRLEQSLICQGIQPGNSIRHVASEQERRTLEAVLRILDGGDDHGQ